jgi:hypothetical protein
MTIVSARSPQAIRKGRRLELDAEVSRGSPRFQQAPAKPAKRTAKLSAAMKRYDAAQEALLAAMLSVVAPLPVKRQADLEAAYDTICDQMDALMSHYLA